MADDEDDPEPELSEEPLPLLLLLLESFELELELALSSLVVVVVVVVVSLACEFAAMPITIVAATAVTARPDVTAIVLRRALSRLFIEPSKVGRFDGGSFNWVEAARSLGIS